MRSRVSNPAAAPPAQDGKTGLAAPYARLRADRRDDASRERLLERVRAEYREMPGLALTLVQAMRLFGLREDVCRRLLSTLVQRRVLQKRNGSYVTRSGVQTRGRTG